MKMKKLVSDSQEKLGTVKQRLLQHMELFKQVLWIIWNNWVMIKTIFMDKQNYMIGMILGWTDPLSDYWNQSLLL